MEVPEDLAGRLRLALKTANLSPGGLGAAVGVDKSVVSRWLSGRVRPTQHNLARIAAALAHSLPGFSVLSFEASVAEFRDLLSGGTPVLHGDDRLPIPFAMLTTARNETARRGAEYVGHYTLYYRAFSAPGRLARMALLLHEVDGLIEARYEAEGFGFRGWALLLLNRLYLILAEERFEAMAFLVMNAGQQPKARFITGILTGPAEALLIPTSSPAVLVRVADVTGDAETDIAAHQERGKAAPLIDVADAPAAVQSVLHPAGLTPSGLLQVPYSNFSG